MGRFFLVLLVFFCAPILSARSAQVDWHVKHPFRYFTDIADFDMQREAMADVLRAGGGAPATLVSDLERLLNDPRWLREWYARDSTLYARPRAEGRAERGWAHHINRRRATCWDFRQQWHSSCRSDAFGNGLRTDYVLPRAHTVVFSVKDAPVGRCKWEAVRPVFIGQGTSLTSTVEAACDASVSARIPFEPDISESQRGVDVSVGLPDGSRLRAGRVWVRDRLIVGIGDSYSSGEGNPDTPVEIDPKPTVNGANISFIYDPEQQKLRSVPAVSLPTRYKNSAAGWLDRKCHRSAYSYHLRTALQVALADPKHSAVTFLGYACSGAEVTEGFLFPYAGVETADPNYFSSGGKARRNMPQLDRLTIELCRDDLTRKNSRKIQLDQPITYNGRTLREVSLLHCPTGRFLRPIDMMIISIGGNDVGFTPLIIDVLTKSPPPYVSASGFGLPTTHLRALDYGSKALAALIGLVKERHGVFRAKEKAEELPARFTALRKALTSLPIARSNGKPNIVLTAFPKVEFSQNGRLCGESDPRERMEGMNVGGAVSINVPELREVSTFVNKNLYPALKQAAEAGNWYFADSHRDVFATHGICAQKRSASGVTAFENLMLPYYFLDNGRNRWFDFEPLSSYRASDFKSIRDTRPYAPRQRWFRTLNDICMFVNFRRNGSPPIGRNLGIAVVIEACMGGPFHPTAEGHAHVADAIYSLAKNILQLPAPNKDDLREY